MKKYNASLLLPMLLIMACALSGCRAATTSFPALKDPAAIVYPEVRFEPPRAERWELENGMVLFFMENREIPLVKLSAVARAGSVYDPAGREGLAEMTAAVMRTGGTVEMSPDEFDDELDYLAAELGISAEAEAFSINLTVSENNFDSALKLFRDMLMTPAFADERLELARNLKIEELKRIPDNPQRLAFREFSKLLYGDTPWGRPPSFSSLRTITGEDCRHFHRHFLFPANMMIAVTGAISALEIKSKLTDLFASRPTVDSIVPVDAPLPARSMPSYYLHRDVPQSVIIAGHMGPGKKSPDYYAMTVLDFIIGGGGFRSRMFMEIRSRLGLAYSAGSFYRPRSDFGTFGAYVLTGPGTTAAAITLTLSIVDSMSADRIDEETLNWAKRSLTNSYIFAFTSPHQIALGQMMNEFHGLPEDFIRTYPAGINSVSPDDVLKAAQRYLNSDYRTLMTLGNTERFEKPLTDFGHFQEINSDLLLKAAESGTKSSETNRIIERNYKRSWPVKKKLN